MLKAEDMPNGGVLLRSDDGRAWQAVDAGASGLDAGAILDLAANPTAVVILGTIAPMTGSGTETPTVAEWVSGDGIGWTRAPDSSGLRAINARAIVGSASGFAAPADSEFVVLMSGPDGRQWRRTPLPAPAGARGGVNRVVATARGFLAVGTVEGRSALWRWEGAGWSRLGLPDTDAITSVAGTDGRIVVTGSTETPDPVNPDRPTIAAIAWESTNGGATWASAGLDLDGITDVDMFTIGTGFVAVLYPNDARAPLAAWRSTRPGAWDPIALPEAGARAERPLVSVVAVSGSRVVLAGNTAGTGAGGDRVVVWVGDLAAP
jgi:hypothetical protein